METRTDFRRFNVGSLECVAISDGSFTYPTANFFPGAPPDLLAAAFGSPDAPPPQITSPYTCLAVKVDDQWVLLDTGAAGMGPTTGNLQTNLQAFWHQAKRRRDGSPYTRPPRSYRRSSWN